MCYWKASLLRRNEVLWICINPKPKKKENLFSLMSLVGTAEWPSGESRERLCNYFPSGSFHVAHEGGNDNCFLKLSSQLFGKIQFQITVLPVVAYGSGRPGQVQRMCLFKWVSWTLATFESDLSALIMERSEMVPISATISTDSGKEWNKVVLSMMPNVAKQIKWLQCLVIFAAVFSPIETIDYPSQSLGFS